MTFRAALRGLYWALKTLAESRLKLEGMSQFKSKGYPVFTNFFLPFPPHLSSRFSYPCILSLSHGLKFLAIKISRK